MKAAVVVFPGSNCDRDVAVALEQSSGFDPIMVWHGDSELPDVDLIVIPGGFSYGDYLRSGAMAAHSPIMREVTARARKGVPTLGICNGFQILCETGLLPGSLMRNAGLKFICRKVHMRVEDTESVFTRGYRPGQVVTMPIAHFDGNYFADDGTIEGLKGNGLIAYRYCDDSGAVTPAGNPNGSLDNIAGIFDPKRTILGMMPHPERAAGARIGGEDGRPLFDALVEALG